MSKKDATELFASERAHHGLCGIVGNVRKSSGGEDLYPTVEEKAAHLLYFNPLHITPETLTALTLLIAESPANEKDPHGWLGSIAA